MTLAGELEAIRETAAIPAVAGVRVSSSGIDELAVTGVRRADGADEVRETDRFHIGSNAKAMTAMLAALAVKRGAIGWETTAGEVLGLGEPTLRQLLSHASGLNPYGDDDEMDAVGRLEGTPEAQRAAFARIALAEEPLFAPGTRHEYSNAGLAVAASMVETVTGEPWESALRTQLWNPLGIDGRVGWPALHDPAAPFGHRVLDRRLVPHDPALDDYALPVWARPAGDVSVSIGDYGAFLVDQLAGLRGAGRLGPVEMYRALHTPDPPDADDDVAYGAGWGIRVGPNGPISQHTGSAETFYAVVVLEPDRDRGMAVVANSYSEDHVSAANGVVKGFLSRA